MKTYTEHKMIMVFEDLSTLPLFASSADVDDVQRRRLRDKEDTKQNNSEELTTHQIQLRHGHQTMPEKARKFVKSQANTLSKLQYVLALLFITSSSILVTGDSSSGRGGGDSRDLSMLVRSLSSVPTPSPEDSFLEQPSNTSVVKGQVAVMKCKAKQAVNHCRWYYLEAKEDFYDDAAEPKLVKDFKPSNDIDCSIRFTKVRKVQEGQWLCQARRYMSTVFYNTRPAFLEVITESDEREYDERNTSTGLDDSDEAGPQQTIPRPVGPTIRPRPTNIPGPSDPNGGGQPPRHQHRPRDPTAPTAIPALGPPPNTEHRPNPHQGRIPVPPRTGGPSRTGGGRGPTKSPRAIFAYSLDEQIQNTRTGLSATLPCQVNTPVASCSWVMPNNAFFVWSEADSSVGRSLSINTAVVPDRDSEYEFVGDRARGNCSLTVHRVRHHDEGNWRCVVGLPRTVSPPVHPAMAASATPALEEVKGPLLHLHLLDFHHNQHGVPQPTMTTGTNITLIILFLVGLILFIVGTIIIYCCYKRVWSKSDETNKNLQQSVRSNESEYTQQWFQGRNLKIADPNYTDDFKLRNVDGNYSVRKIDTMNLKNSHVQYSDIDHYNEYLKMNHGIGGSVRSSASSNTTLSTVAPDPLGRDRTISFNTTPSMSPINMNGRMSHQSHIMAPNGTILTHSPVPSDMENVSFYEVHRKIQRPVSLYSTGHVYEEIQEKMPPYNPYSPQPHVMTHGQGIVVNAQGIPIGAMASTPVYTNVVEDHDGYLIPNKSAKIVNTPTGDVDPSQYLAMTGDVLPGPHTKALLEPQYQPQNVHINNMNNLSLHQAATTHMQIIGPPTDQQISRANLGNQRRHSNDSQLSVEQNGSPEKMKSEKVYSPSKEVPGHPNPNINTTTPTKLHNSSKTSSTTSNFKRQRMPLPNHPITVKSNQQPKFPLNQQLSNSKINLSSSLHQRTTSLPDTSIIPTLGVGTHAKSPSLVPTPEDYDVPRSLGDVPRTVNGSEVSLDDIDGTIV